MRKRSSEQIGAVISQFMRQSGLETPYNQYKIIEAWPEVMGDTISRFTANIFIKNQTLNVQITSPIVKNELMMQHRALARKLNEHIGAQVIEDIKFY